MDKVGIGIKKGCIFFVTIEVCVRWGEGGGRGRGS